MHYLFSQNLMARLLKRLLPIVENYCLEQSRRSINQEVELSIISEETLSQRNSGTHFESTKHQNDQKQNLSEFAKAKRPEEFLDKSSEREKKNVLRKFRQEELVYSILYLIYNALSKGDFSIYH